MKNIFVLEDEVSILNEYKDKLSEAGFNVLAFSSIEKAQQGLLTDPDISCILTDLNLVTTGLSDSEIAQSFGSILTGWIFMKNYIINKPKYKI